MMGVACVLSVIALTKFWVNEFGLLELPGWLFSYRISLLRRGKRFLEEHCEAGERQAVCGWGARKMICLLERTCVIIKGSLLKSEAGKGRIYRRRGCSRHRVRCGHHNGALRSSAQDCLHPISRA